MIPSTSTAGATSVRHYLSITKSSAILSRFWLLNARYAGAYSRAETLAYCGHVLRFKCSDYQAKKRRCYACENSRSGGISVIGDREVFFWDTELQKPTSMIIEA